MDKMPYRVEYVDMTGPPGGKTADQEVQRVRSVLKSLRTGAPTRRTGRRLAFPVMALLLAFTLGILVGLVIALIISMQTFQADFIYPAALGWDWA